jgi:hypothetical protein
MGRQHPTSARPVAGWHKAGEVRPLFDLRRREFITLLGGAVLA